MGEFIVLELDVDFIVASSFSYELSLTNLEAGFITDVSSPGETNVVGAAVGSTIAILLVSGVFFLVYKNVGSNLAAESALPAPVYHHHHHQQQQQQQQQQGQPQHQQAAYAEPVGSANAFQKADPA